MRKIHKNDSEIIYLISPSVKNKELNELFANAWGDDEPTDFRPILKRSLAFICAYCDKRLIGFVNLAWDGGIHAFILDTTVHKEFRRRGIGLKLVKQAETEAQKRRIQWLHVDFEPHLQSFYYKCGFRNTNAGLINLK
jgi:ribosomal protein S18 acetylase RimI-like enzyme